MLFSEVIMKRLLSYFTLEEKILWVSSVVLIFGSELVFRTGNWAGTLSSVLGVTSLIFAAKGNAFGQILMILFCTAYSLLSLSCRYYGELITYACMTGPMAVMSLISWLRHPFKGNKREVTVNTVRAKEIPLIVLLTVAVTVAFWFILGAFHTANLIPSTLSVSTSFVAVYLSFRRSPYFAVAYMCNDVVLILLWAMATAKSISYLAMVICFVVFLANDLYGFVSWRRMQKRQERIIREEP